MERIVFPPAAPWYRYEVDDEVCGLRVLEVESPTNRVSKTRYLVIGEECSHEPYWVQHQSMTRRDREQRWECNNCARHERQRARAKSPYKLETLDNNSLVHLGLEWPCPPSQVGLSQVDLWRGTKKAKSYPTN